MTERSKRMLLVCAVGWFIGGQTTLDHVMAAVGGLLLASRVYFFRENGTRR